jgi:hypothetical protein
MVCVRDPRAKTHGYRPVSLTRQGFRRGLRERTDLGQDLLAASQLHCGPAGFVRQFLTLFARRWRLFFCDRTQLHAEVSSGFESRSGQHCERWQWLRCVCPLAGQCGRFPPGRMNRRRFAILSASIVPVLTRGAEEEGKVLTPLFEAICSKHGVPAVTGGLISTDGLQYSAAAGVRKAGGRTPVTTSDLWHLGSITKSLTATLVATFVMENQLKWDAKLGDLLPNLMEKATPQARGITVKHLLTHRSGLPANADGGDLLRGRRAPVRPEWRRRRSRRRRFNYPVGFTASAASAGRRKIFPKPPKIQLRTSNHLPVSPSLPARHISFPGAQVLSVAAPEKSLL